MQEQKPRESVLKMMEALREYDAMLKKMSPEEHRRERRSVGKSRTAFFASQTTVWKTTKPKQQGKDRVR